VTILIDKVFASIPASEWAGAPLDFWQALRPCAWMEEQPSAAPAHPSGPALHALRSAGQTWKACAERLGTTPRAARQRYVRWCAATGTEPAQTRTKQEAAALAREAARLARHFKRIREAQG
jgi:hypothetical protein